MKKSFIDQLQSGKRTPLTKEILLKNGFQLVTPEDDKKEPYYLKAAPIQTNDPKKDPNFYSLEESLIINGISVEWLIENLKKMPFPICMINITLED